MIRFDPKTSKVLYRLATLGWITLSPITLALSQQWLNYTNGDHITSIAVAPNHDLWIGLRGGVLHYSIQTGLKNKFTIADGLLVNDVMAVASDPAGQVWAGGSWGHGLSSFNGTSWSRHVLIPGALWPSVGRYQISNLQFDQNGGLWITSVDGVATIPPGGSWNQLATGWQPSCLAIKNGEIWIGTYSVGLKRYNAGTFITYDTGWLNDIDLDSTGRVWCATQYSGIKILQDSIWQTLDISNSNMPSNQVLKLKIDGKDRVWAVFYIDSLDGHTLAKYDGTTWQTFDSTNSPLSNKSWISCIATDTGDVTYFGTKPKSGFPHVGGGFVYLYSNGLWKVLDVSLPGLAISPVEALATDGTGSILFGTSMDGISKFDGHHWSGINSSNSDFYPSNNVSLIAAGQDAKIWAKGHGWTSYSNKGSEYFPGGLATFDGANWRSYSESDTLFSNLTVADITGMAGFGNAVYFGTSSKGLYKLDANTLTQYDTSNSQVRINSIGKIKIDRDGNLWLFGQKLVKYDGSDFTVILDSIPITDYRGIDVSPNGIVWVTSGGSPIRRFDGSTWQSYEIPWPWNGNEIRSIAVDNSGVVWLGTFGTGVLSFDGNSFQNFNGANSGLGYDFIEAIVVDFSNNKYFLAQDYGGGVTVFNASGISGITQHDRQLLPTMFSYSLMQNFPNPFNPSTTIRYKIPVRSTIRLSIFNILGQQVITLAEKQVEAGNYEQLWNAETASGVYFCRLEAIPVDEPNKRFVDVKRMVLLK